MFFFFHFSDAQHALALFLRDHGFVCPVPITTPSGEYRQTIELPADCDDQGKCFILLVYLGRYSIIMPNKDFLGLTSLLNICGYIATVFACSSVTLTDICAATHECHAADTGHTTPSHHSIQTQGRPVVVLSIDEERHTGPNYTTTHFNVLGPNRSGNPSPTFHIQQ